LEAEKIRERTMRGIRERAKAGKFPSGRRARLYGYTYIPGKEAGQGIRQVNESEAKWVREIFRWMVEERLTLNGITYRLRELGIPTPSGKGYWIRSTVYGMLTNTSYIGKTYCFTHVHKETDKHYKENRKGRKTAIEKRPHEEGLEIEGATPPIIEPWLFESVQEKLRQNKSQPNREGKVKYLLRGHLYCSRCGRKYWGYARERDGQPAPDRRYYCMGRRTIITPDKCDNSGHKADPIESIVWQQVERILSRPDLVLGELKRRKEQAGAEGQSHWEQRQRAVEAALGGWEKRMDRLARALTIGLPEDSFKRELDELNREKAELQRQKAELEAKIIQASQLEASVEGIERFCALARQNLSTFGYAEKRLALDALAIKVWVDGSDLTIEGAIPDVESAVLSAPRSWNR
ncbi:MAG: recombinase family protein, partial [Dehalococcoidia bacterium]